VLRRPAESAAGAGHARTGSAPAGLIVAEITPPYPENPPESPSVPFLTDRQYRLEISVAVDPQAPSVHQAPTGVGPSVPQPVAPDRVLDQLGLLVRNSPTAIVGNLAASAIVVWLLWGRIPTAWLIGWWLAMAILMALRARLVRGTRGVTPDPRDAQRRCRGIVANALAAGVLWGLAGFAFQLGSLDDARRFGLALALAGVVAVGPGTIAAWPRAGIVYVVIVMLPLAARLALNAGVEQSIMALMTLVYTLVMAGVARRNHDAVAESLDLRHDARERQRSLAASERRFEALTETSPAAVFIVQDGRYVYANPAAAALTGYAPAELRDKPFGDIVHPEHRERVRANARARAAGLLAPTRSEVPLVTRTGALRWLDGSIAALEVDGRPGWVIVAVDITERRASEDALRQARDAAEAAAHAKDLFLATISHEIRTPLNGMLGMAQLLEDSPLDPARREQLALLRASGDALRVLIDDLLDLSKIEAGRLELEQRDFALRPALERTLALYRPLIDRKGLAFDVRFAPTLPLAVRGDSTRLCQILSNLVANALKFTHAGAIGVTVDTVTAPGSAPPAEASDAGVALRMSVSDTGVGIPPDRLERLFKPFSQVDSSTTREFGGTGLGLSIARRLAEAMDGRIEVDSRPGEGSTFRVMLRLGAAAAGGQAGAPQAGGQAGEAALARAGADLSTLKVLVAEDNPTNRLLAVAALTRMGVSADTANDGQEALARAQVGDYDLILMDMQMPVMDGLDATRAIRALALPRPPRIVALTANAFATDRERCLAAGMDDFLAKPLDLATLRAMLEAFAAGTTRASSCAVPPAASASADASAGNAQARSSRESGH